MNREVASSSWRGRSRESAVTRRRAINAGNVINRARCLSKCIGVATRESRRKARERWSGGSVSG